MRTKSNLYMNSEYKALVNGKVVPDEGASYQTVSEAERVARAHAQAGDEIEVYDVTHQTSVVVTRIRHR